MAIRKVKNAVRTSDDEEFKALLSMIEHEIQQFKDRIPTLEPILDEELIPVKDAPVGRKLKMMYRPIGGNVDYVTRMLMQNLHWDRYTASCIKQAVFQIVAEELVKNHVCSLLWFGRFKLTPIRHTKPQQYILFGHVKKMIQPKNTYRIIFKPSKTLQAIVDPDPVINPEKYMVINPDIRVIRDERGIIKKNVRDVIIEL